jgi:hypothetical protein
MTPRLVQDVVFVGYMVSIKDCWSLCGNVLIDDVLISEVSKGDK